ncbi:MAG: 2Fe-2S iron-sulfur cluster binding domain-containing protein [Chthonomonadales bacterium]|nr:2Fe-2S iron-sulfur cluster binding domain-containing protein [Chthonomonadales bacterium]
MTAAKGDTLLDAALDSGLAMPHDCGGNCSCTSCHVQVIRGAEWLSPMQEPEEDRLATSPARGPGSRLACQALLIGGDVTARILGDRDPWSAAAERFLAADLADEGPSGVTERRHEPSDI